MKRTKSILRILFASAIAFLYMGCDTRQETKKPVACFNYIPTDGVMPGEEVTFTNCSTDAESYSWNFGDGSPTAVASDPRHTFQNAGSYDVVLIVTNKNLRDQTQQTIIVESDIEACFTMEKTTAMVGETVTLTNCSTGATSYEWDVENDGIIDAEYVDVDVTYAATGTYEIKLKAKNGSEYDEVIHDITITPGNSTFDPTVYDSPVTWVKYYGNDFDAVNDWSEATTADYSKIISNGKYIITNLTAENSWYFWTNAIGMPATTENYDYEIAYLVDYDYKTQGNGIFSSCDNISTFDSYFLKLTVSSGTSYYTYGNKNNSPWAAGFYGTGGDIGAYNKLTIRKYESNVYYFVNEVYKGTLPFEGNYGDKFGLISGGNSKMTVEWISIYTMNFGSRKSGTIKAFELSTNKNDKTSMGLKASEQPDNQAIEFPRTMPSLK